MDNLLHLPAFKRIAEFEPVVAPDQQVHLVGGAVRDLLINRSTEDLDFVVSHAALDLARRVADHLGGDYYALEATRGAGRVVLTDETGRQLHIDFVQRQGDNLEADLRIRDFTTNAIAIDIRAPSQIIDPLHGAADLHGKLLRACSATALRDDPVRVLRALRQAASFGLKIEAETRAQIRASAPFLHESSAERRRDEVMKILADHNPFATLQAMDILDISRFVFPDLMALKGRRQPPPFVHDAWNHSLQTVKRLTQLLDMLGEGGKDAKKRASFVLGLATFRLGRYRAELQTHLDEAVVPERTWRAGLFLAALFANAGKSEVFREDLPEALIFSGHEAAGALTAVQASQAMKLSAHECQRIRSVITHQMRPAQLLAVDTPPSALAIYRFFHDIGQSGIDILLLHLASTWATHDSALQQDHWLDVLELQRTLWEAYWEARDQFIDPPALVNGRDLTARFSLQPGPQIGALLEFVREGQVSGQINDKAGALEHVHKRLESESNAQG